MSDRELRSERNRRPSADVAESASRGAGAPGDLDWSGKRDSNPRLRPWQGRTLPLSYSRPRQPTEFTQTTPDGQPLCPLHEPKRPSHTHDFQVGTTTPSPSTLAGLTPHTETQVRTRPDRSDSHVRMVPLSNRIVQVDRHGSVFCRNPEATGLAPPRAVQTIASARQPPADKSLPRQTSTATSDARRLEKHQQIRAPIAQLKRARPSDAARRLLYIVAAFRLDRSSSPRDPARGG
jgi:hypothetical protein